MAGFFRLELGGPGAEPAFKPYFDGTNIEPASTEPADTHTSYHAPSSDRRDVNIYKVNADLSTNELGGAVKQKKLTPFDLCGGEPPSRSTACRWGRASSRTPWPALSRPSVGSASCATAGRRRRRRSRTRCRRRPATSRGSRR